MIVVASPIANATEQSSIVQLVFMQSLGEIDSWLRRSLLLLAAVLPLVTFAGANTVTVQPSLTVLDAKGGLVSFTVSIERDVSVSSVALNLLTPTSQWSFNKCTGTTTPDIKPTVGETGNKGDGLGFLYLIVPPSPTSFTVTLKYPTGVTEKQFFQFQGSFMVASGAAETVTTSVSIDPPPVAPSIVTQPLDISTAVGLTASFAVAVTGTTPLSYQWKKNNVIIQGAVDSTYEIAASSLTDAASYVVVITNSMATITSRVAKLTVSAVASAPTITTQPANISAKAGDGAKFTVVAGGTSPFTYQWYKDGLTLIGATSPSYSISNVQPADVGLYTVKITNAASSITSAAASLSVTQVAGTPVITTQPGDYIGKTGDAVSLRVAVTSTTGVTYQWYKDGTLISGATTSTYLIRSLVASDVAFYTVKITNTAGSITSRSAMVGIGTAGYISALAIRTNAGAGDQTLIVGLVVAGGGNGQGKSVMSRVVGPGLSKIDSTLTNLIPDPVMTVYSATGSVISQNDDWGGTAALRSAFSATGVSSLDSASKDAALLSELSGGAYMVHVSDATGKSGLALVEIYDASPIGGNSTRLSAVSARATAGADQNILIAGLIISGDTGKKLLIRGMGPSLSKDGIMNYITDPILSVYNVAGAVVATNDNWGGAVELKSAFAAIGSALPPDTSKDAALVVTLPPGGYSVQVSGVGGSQGVALVDIWEIP